MPPRPPVRPHLNFLCTRYLLMTPTDFFPFRGSAAAYGVSIFLPFPFFSLGRSYPPLFHFLFRAIAYFTHPLLMAPSQPTSPHRVTFRTSWELVLRRFYLWLLRALFFCGWFVVATFAASGVCFTSSPPLATPEWKAVAKPLLFFALVPDEPPFRSFSFLLRTRFWPYDSFFVFFLFLPFVCLYRVGSLLFPSRIKFSRPDAAFPFLFGGSCYRPTARQRPDRHRIPALRSCPAVLSLFPF